MRIRYKFIHFVKVGQKGKTSVWECQNNSSQKSLGTVMWHSQWRQYCYFPNELSVYSAGCLEDIINFMVELRKTEQAGLLEDKDAGKD